MAQAKSNKLGNLIVQALILVSLVSFFFSGNATAGGGSSPQEQFQKSALIQALTRQPPGNS